MLHGIDAFDQYGEQAAISNDLSTFMKANGWVHTGAGGTGYVSQAYGRFTDSLGFRVVCGFNNTNSLLAYTPSYPNSATEFWAHSFYVSVFGGAGTQGIVQFLDGGSIQIEFRLDASNRIAIYKGSTLLVTSSASLSSAQWYRAEFKCFVDGSAGIAEVKIGGVVFVTYTGNTKATANAYTNKIAFGCFQYGGGGAQTDIWCDDVVWYNDDSSSQPYDYLGDKRIIWKPANAAGDVSNFTPAWASWAASTVMAVGQQILDSNGNIQRVQSITSDFKTGSGSHPTWDTTGGNTTSDNHVTWVVVGSGANPGAANWMATAETPPDDDNSYNASSTIGNIDRFVSAAFPATCTGIVLMYETIYSRKDDAGARSLRGSINSAGSVADNGSDFAQNSTYAYSNPVFLTDPNGAIAWTIGAVNALDWGYKVTA